MEKRSTAVRPPLSIRIVRNLLRRLNYHLSRTKTVAPPEPFDRARLQRVEAALRTMRAEPGCPGVLGCYMQITPLLEHLCGYREVRGAHYGPLGRTDWKTIPFGDRQFCCFVDHLDAERDRFPYPDGHFDLVVAGEVIEHLTYDPMYLLLESRRVLAE